MEDIEVYKNLLDRHVKSAREADTHLYNIIIPVIEDLISQDKFKEAHTKLDEFYGDSKTISGKYDFLKVYIRRNKGSRYWILKENIGKKVHKLSKKPFKSGQLINTIKDVIVHPILHIPAYTFYEDDSHCEIRKCQIINVSNEL